MPCTEMKELEANYSRFADRRHAAIPTKSERRKVSAGRLRADQARAAFVMLLHRQTCLVCRREN